MELLKSTEGILLTIAAGIALYFGLFYWIMKEALFATNKILEEQNKLLKILLKKEGVNIETIDEELKHD